MKPELRERIIAFNKARVADKEKAEHLKAFFNALPSEVIKLLMLNDTCAEILRKYGIADDD